MDKSFLYLITDEGNDILLNVNQIAHVNVVSDDHVRLYMSNGNELNFHGTGASAIFLAIAERSVIPGGVDVSKIIEKAKAQADSPET